MKSHGKKMSNQKSKQIWSILSKTTVEVSNSGEHLILLFFNKKFWRLHFQSYKAIREYNKVNPPDKLKQMPLLPLISIVPTYLSLLSFCIVISMFALNKLEVYNEHMLAMTGAFYAIPSIFFISKIGNRIVRRYYNRIRNNYHIMKKIVVK